MPDPVRAKLGLIGATAAAFAGGILLASGFQWTQGSQAAALLQAAPTRADVRPVAELSQAFISIAESVTPAVVAIETERTGSAGGREREDLREMFPFFRFPDEDQPRPRTASGSGFVISEDGYIITNNHVVEGADKITVILQDNRHLHATLVGRDPTTDVAVIRVEGGRLPAVRLGSSEGTRIGEWVLAIGNPLDLGTTVTSGIVSAKGRALPILRQTSAGQWAIEDFIQTDAPINPGNSGGPLVNLRGEVVGVNSAIASPTGFYSGYGFAVPIDLARKVADDLIRYGKVRRPALGITLKDVRPEDAEVFKLPRIMGVVVNDFTRDSPAREVGVRQGDVVVAADGVPVERTGQFQRLIATRRPGEEVTLDVIRYGERRQFRVKLMEAETPAGQLARAEEDDRPAPATEEERGQRLGVVVQPLTAELVKRYQIPGEARGLVITQVDPYGAAGRQGVQEGARVLSVDGQPVPDVAAFRRALDRKRPGEIVSLVLVYPSGQQSLENIRLPE